MNITITLNRAAVERELARRKLTQNGLALKAGLSSGYLSQLMCAARHPSAQTRAKLQRSLQPLTLDDLFTVSPPPLPAAVNPPKATSHRNYWKDRQRELGSFNCPKCGKRLHWHYRLVSCFDCNSAWNVDPNTRKLI